MKGGWTCDAGRTKEMRKYRNRRAILVMHPRSIPSPCVPARGAPKWAPVSPSRRPELAPHFDGRDMICKVKQDVWLTYQQPRLRARAAGLMHGSNLSATVSFESFANHPLWLEDAARAKLKVKATNCEEVGMTPRRSRQATREWMADADDALRALSANASAGRDTWRTCGDRLDRLVAC